jgi:predicted O-linked N-acetylglucosamine transferase (SPINDLY family)
MGVPMPSAPNIGTGSNASASCLHHVGCPDLIANSNNEYLSIVGELARDTNRLIQLRQSLRSQMEQTVCNGERFCRDLEAVFRSMWLRNCGMSIQESGLPLIDCLAGAASCTH